MTLFRFRWLRRYIRRNTNPIPIDRAALWKQRIAVTYSIIAWNAFGFVAYMIYQGKADWAKYYDVKSEDDVNVSPGHQWAKTLGIENAQVYRVKGLSLNKIDEEQGVNNKKTLVDG
ncbi:uncharacterized protein LOC130893099 [Diorhabda carinulata]|uniref:uncharacterized protein LOC130445488 n=1 Tax=Diorhabda sublineata TaxID=1163346 RepID=UPI0024E0C6E3|nr:uncharacterized protein LOC130445488 [Diorhabda sublineata]XP_057654879.1 uncharacterized protein LOC130893099 [Diorhabda carinulata]